VSKALPVNSESKVQTHVIPFSTNVFWLPHVPPPVPSVVVVVVEPVVVVVEVVLVEVVDVEPVVAPVVDVVDGGNVVLVGEVMP
jgi:hypothetical protein